MTKRHRSGTAWGRPAFAAAALAGPLLVLSPHLPLAGQASQASHPGQASQASHPGHASQASHPGHASQASHPGQASQASHPGHASPTPSATAKQSAEARRAAAAALRAAAKRPALSIAVTDGRHTVRPGVLLTYTVKIRNIGTVGVPRLRIEQTLPPGLKLVSASPPGARGAGQVRWQLRLSPGHTGTFHTVARVGKTPKQILALASVACASISNNGAPVVCATDANPLPGRTAAAAGAPPSRAGTGTGAGHVELAGIVLAAVIAAVGGWWLATRRRARHTA